MSLTNAIVALFAVLMVVDIATDKESKIESSRVDGKSRDEHNKEMMFNDLNSYIKKYDLKTSDEKVLLVLRDAIEIDVNRRGPKEVKQTNVTDYEKYFDRNLYFFRSNNGPYFEYKTGNNTLNRTSVISSTDAVVDNMFVFYYFEGEPDNYKEVSLVFGKVYQYTTTVYLTFVTSPEKKFYCAVGKVYDEFLTETYIPAEKCGPYINYFYNSEGVKIVV